MKHVKLFEEFLNESNKVNPIIDVLMNSMEHYDETDFMDLGSDFGLDSDTMLDIYNDYWTVGAKERTNWDIKNWSKWLKKHGVNESKDSDTFVGNPGEDKRLVDIRAFRGSVKDLTDYVNDKAKESQVSEGAEIKTATNKHGEHFKIGDTIVAPDNKPVKIIGFQKGKDGHMKAQYNAGMFVDVYNLDDVEKV
jgi:hypothetical protein